jgi:hypothetical protein
MDLAAYLRRLDACALADMCTAMSERALSLRSENTPEATAWADTYDALAGMLDVASVESRLGIEL